MDLSICRELLDRKIAKWQLARDSIHKEKETLQNAKEKVENTILAQQLIQGIAEKVQAAAHAQIASVVTKCLQAVFGEEESYTFHIKFSRKRGKTEAELLFARNGKYLDSDAVGGGVVDVTSFALRLACLLLLRPKKRRLLVLDEPWKMVSKNYRSAIRELVMSLAKDLKMQFIIVTHTDEFRMGEVIEIE
jgi:ABC-type branched-subunit amino acid transport system ATPase component